MPTSIRGLAAALGAKVGAASRPVAKTAARTKVRFVFISCPPAPRNPLGGGLLRTIQESFHTDSGPPALPGRHFYTYEKFAEVCQKEMQEARVDIVFASFKKDAAFVALTAEADGGGRMQH